MKQSLLLLILSAFLLAAGSCKKNAAPQLLGKEPISISPEKCEEDALIEWARKGYQGMTLIHMDTSGSLGLVSDHTIQVLSGIIRSRNWSRLKESAGEGSGGLLTGSNYLSAAVGLGIVRKIFWVIPYPFFEQAGGGERARQFLVDTGLVKDRTEAAAFFMDGGCLHGRARGAEILLCAPDTMHLIKEPVLLDLNSGFFTAFARNHGLSPLEGFKLCIDALFERNYRVATANISNFLPEYFDPVSLYIGAQLRDVLTNPSIMRQEEPPPVWSARDEGEKLLRQRKFRRAYDTVRASVSKFGPDKGLRALGTTAAAQLGKYDEALTEAARLCQADKQYCPLLLHLARLAGEKGRSDKAEVFFKRAVEALPDRLLERKRRGSGAEKHP